MTGPHPEEDEQHVVIHLDAGAQPEPWQAGPPVEAETPVERPAFLQRYRYGLVAILLLAVLAGAAYAIGAATYDPPSRLPALVFRTDDQLYGVNAPVEAEMQRLRETYGGQAPLDLAPVGTVFELPLPRTVADRLFGRRDEVATIFSARGPMGDLRVLILSDGDETRIIAVEAPPGVGVADQPTGVFVALDPSDPALGRLHAAVASLVPRLGDLPEEELSADDYYVFGPYQRADGEALRSRVEGNVVMEHLAESIEAADGEVSMAAPVFLVARRPSRGTINALYHTSRRLVMEPLWGDSSDASLAHELVHAYLDTVTSEKLALLSEAASYFESAHPVLHGEVVGDLYNRLGREGRAEETLAFLVGAVAAGQSKTVSTQRLLENPGNLAISEAVLHADIRLLVEAALLPACMLPREDANGEITHEYYGEAEAACALP